MRSERIPPEVRTTAARITAELSEGLPAQPDALVNTFISMCEALPPECSAIDVVSSLRPSVRRELESIALRRFQRRLRPRASNATAAPIPRAITELRSAARLWGVSTLVLLVEFADAPMSDNFWRTVAKLARCRGGSDWPAVRGRLHVERDRRRLDVLVRRKGVSRTLPWTIPDVEAVLKQQQGQTQEEDLREIERQENGQQDTVMVINEIHRTASKQYANTPPRSPDGSTSQSAQRRRQQQSPGRPATRRSDPKSRRLSRMSPPSGRRDEKRAATGRVQQAGAPEDVSHVSNAVSPSDRRAQAMMWPLVVGWWLWDDIMHRLCSSLAQFRPVGFTAVDPVFSNLAPPSTAALASLPASTTDNVLIVPFSIRTPTHWVLALISRAEKLVSVFDPLPGQHCRAATRAALERCFSRILPGQYLTDWAIVTRSCQLTQNGVESGVIVVITALYCIIGRPVASDIDIWLWRRLLACYLSRLSEDPEEAGMAKDVAESHNAMYEREDSADNAHRGAAAHVRTSLAERRAALKDDAIEARLVWAAVAGLMSHAEVGARMGMSARQRIGKAQSAITAVFNEIDWILGWLRTT